MPFGLLQCLLVLYALHGTRCVRDANISSNITVITNPPQLCSSQPCHFSSLDDLAITHNLVWDTTIDITLSTGSLDLNVVIEFADINEVWMRGGGGDYSDWDWTKVRCRGEHTGIKFTGVQRVHLEHMRLRGCGMPSEYGGVNKASVIIYTATLVTINNIILTQPTETGLALIDVATSDINSCVFERESHNGGFHVMKSGLYIEVNRDDTSHVINNCNFTGSAADPGASWSQEGGESAACWDQEGENAGMTLSTADHNSADMSTRGAGVRVQMQNLSSRNSLIVTGCSFTRNTAQLGGGVHIGIQDSSKDNKVTITGSEFSENCAYRGGAIAVDILYSSTLGAPPTNNQVKIIECTFTGNTALEGGAVQLSYSQAKNARRELMESTNDIQFDNCTWENNKAHHGAAIEVRPVKTSRQVIDTLTHLLVTLRDCNFKRNTVKYLRDNNVRIRGAGTVKLKKAALQIEGTLQLVECTGSALYLEESTAYLATNSSTTFTGNKGHRGAAVALMGGQRSVITVQGVSHILFKGNKAETIGGAVFQENSEVCFVTRGDDSESTTATESRATFVFDNNTAQSDVGHSVFVNSLKPCMEVTQTENYQEALSSMVDYQLMQNRPHEVATFGRVILDDVFPAAVVPGMMVNLSLHMLDDTNATIETTAILVSTNSPNIYLATGYKNIKILGKPGSAVQIVITPHHRQELQLVMNITLSTCPPGYYYDEKEKICVCSRRYIGIQACNHNFRARLLHSHWAGYIDSEGNNSTNDSIIGEAVFRTAYCPRGFCADTNKTHKDVLLPLEAKDDLFSYVCRKNRTGVLCSQCAANHSAFFPRYACTRNERCKLGAPYYILTQLLPVTILFLLLLAFDVNLTSGQVSGVILYMQMFDALLLTANDFLWFELPVYKTLLSLRVISRMTNLLFFAHRSVSFCLWEGATSLDILAFNYVTVIYSFLLVIFTVKVVSPLGLRIRKHFRRQTGTEHATSGSIIHGLTGFLVLCYSQNTYTSLYLLASVTLHGRGNMDSIAQRVFFNGEIRVFGREHLPYAIPAVFMLTTITVLPPLLLLSYPLCYRVLALCRIQESKFTRVLCRAVPLERYKPLFDSFQGSFKDEHRYFAGLYFMYRLVWLITLAYTRELASYYIVLEVELVLMLFLHAYVQPHKNTWHNRADVCIFTLLAIINACTIYSYHKRNDYTHPSNYTRVVNAIQITIAYLPPLFVAGYLAWVCVRAIRKKVQGNKRSALVNREERGAESMEMISSRSLEDEPNPRIRYNIFTDKM